MLSVLICVDLDLPTCFQTPSMASHLHQTYSRSNPRNSNGAEVTDILVMQINMDEPKARACCDMTQTAQLASPAGAAARPASPRPSEVDCMHCGGWLATYVR